MAYIALYRKYRSQNFGELMGQEATTKTLQNALRSGKLAHAYLFTGARGCGKTSTARLLAKALNCVGPDGERTSPNPEPCDVCRLCVAIREGRCLDVIEIDAASETSIDNVREKIIENVQYAPAEGRCKVYIIDEVHDLSSKAFDALLKTLEEPPTHVVFILATTELQKVPITIQSRCQKYQFKRGSLQDLGRAVLNVIQKEGYTAEPEAVESVARSAEGSWRDALSLLEQVLAYSDGHITSETVQQAIGTVGSETLSQVTETLATGDWSATLGLAADLVDSGKDVRQLMTALAGHLRDLMLISAGARQAATQEMGAEKLAVLLPQAEQFAPQTLLAMMGVLSAEERELRFTNQHRYLLERTLLKLLMVAQGQAIGTPEAGSGPSGVQAVVTPRPTPTRPVVRPAAAAASYSDTNDAEVEYRTPTAEHQIPSTVPPRPALVAHHTPDAGYAPETEDVAEDAPTTPLKMVDTSAPSVEADLPSFLPVASSNLPPATPNLPASATFSADAPPPATPPVNGNSTNEPAPDNAHRFAEGVTLEVMQRAWPRILKLFKQKSPSGIGFLEKAEVVRLDGNIVTLAFSDSFSRDRIQNKGKELVEKKINEGLNTDGYKIRCILQSDMGEGSSAVPVSGPLPTAPTSGQAMQMATLLDTPVVQSPVAPSGIGAFGIEAPAPITTTPAYATYGSSAATNGDSTTGPVANAYVNGNGQADAYANGVFGHSANDNGVSEMPHYANGIASTPVKSAPPLLDPVAPPAPPASNGLLKEVLDLFGGQVVRTE